MLKSVLVCPILGFVASLTKVVKKGVLTPHKLRLVGSRGGQSQADSIGCPDMTLWVVGCTHCRLVGTVACVLCQLLSYWWGRKKLAGDSAVSVEGKVVLVAGDPIGPLQFGQWVGGGFELTATD